MKWMDLKEAMLREEGRDNFARLLMRLIAKADRANRAKLSKGFPVEAEMVGIFQHECPYKTPAVPDEYGLRRMGTKEPDWEEIEREAVRRVEGREDCQDAQV